MVRTMHDGDLAAFGRALGLVWTEAQACDPSKLTAAVEQLVPFVGRVAGTFAKVAVLAGAFVERGASSLPLREVLPNRAAAAMELYELFPAAWAQASGGRPLPDRTGPPTMTDVVRILADDARRRGNSEDGIQRLALSWFDLKDWLNPMITVMARPEFRIAMDHRDRVRAAAAAIAKDIEAARWVHGLSLVLDDEPLIVLDPATGRGFRLTISGVGDNFQLHTLLADRLTGPADRGLLAAPPPESAWVAAATDAEPGPFPSTAPILRRFRLFDGSGAYVHPEGRPYDIEPLEGIRVVVVQPAQGNFGWQFGRVYKHMKPTVTLDQVLDPAEAAHWLSRTSPIRDTDLMAINRGRDQAR